MLDFEIPQICNFLINIYIQMQLDDWVLCKIYDRKSTTLDQRVGRQENTEEQEVQSSKAQPQR